MKDFFEKHIVILWTAISIIFAVVIQVLFTCETSNKWLVAKWEAGDILTYASTVALGLLALWQNNRFKKENDKNEQRMEQLTVRANELSVISKIVEEESTRLINLKRALDNFTQNCDPQTIGLVYAKDMDNRIELMKNMIEHIEKVDSSFFELGRELRVNPELRKNDKEPIKLEMSKLYLKAKEILETWAANPTYDITMDSAILADFRDAFIEARENYLMLQENKLNKLLYDNLSLEEIKKMYRGD